jgi:pimeloyl-ACP methyl ester carboxylesterase
MTNNIHPPYGGPPPHFIVIVPGYMGSLLKDKRTGEIVWLDLPGLVKKLPNIDDAIKNILDKMHYPNPDLEPAGILNQVLIAPPLFKQEQYIRLAEKLAKWGYKIDPKAPKPDDLCAYTFSYDWRQDNRISGRQLGEFVTQLEMRHPGAKAWLLGHSNGGIISRWYIQKEGGKDHVGRMFYMASPWDGAPKTMMVLMNGLEAMGLKYLNFWDLGARMQELVRTFPSFYQLIPHKNPFLHNEDNEVVDLFNDTRWLDNDTEKAMLADALQFNLDLEGDPSVETICFYGTRKPTTTAGIANFLAGGKIEAVKWIEIGAGDGTVPERSGIHPWLPKEDRLPFPASHGDIYVDDGVLEFLHRELIDRYKDGKRAALFLPDISVVFEPDKDFYTPGEKMSVWMQISDPKTGQPLSKVTVKAWVSFREALPGLAVKKRPDDSVAVRLKESKTKAGYYENVLTAPAVEGYYDVVASLKVVQKPQMNLTELVVVEKLRDKSTRRL